MENKQTTNQIRNILMNELGLTRESIRELATEIIDSTVEKHIKQLISDKYMQNLIEKNVIKALGNGQFDKDVLYSKMEDTITREFAQEIRSKLRGW